MHKLKVLNIFCSNKNKKCKVSISPRDYDLQFLPNSLRFLHWEGYPWKSFPSSFRPRYLVEINLPYSKVNKLWEGSLHLPSLKKIDLSNSKNLTRLPDLSQASKLEHVYLEYCTSLQEVPSYFQHLNELRTLFLEGCSSIREFPTVSKSIVCLVLSGTEIERAPSSIEHLSCLETLSLNYCRKLNSLPNISNLILTLKVVTLEGTSLVPSPHNSPWWTTNIIVHSPESPCQLDRTSSSKTCARKQYRLIPSLKYVQPFIELPRSAFYKGSHMYFMRKGIIGTSYVGMKIPKWFHYQSSHNRVVIELPPNSLNSDFLGFSVCVSYKIFNPYYSTPRVKLFCKMKFMLNNGGTLSWDCCFDKDDWMTEREMITHVAFEFSFDEYDETCNPSSNGYIMKCGIHLLYEEDGKRFGLLNQRDWEEELHRAYVVDAKQYDQMNHEGWEKTYETIFDQEEEDDDDDDDEYDDAKLREEEEEEDIDAKSRRRRRRRRRSYAHRGGGGVGGGKQRTMQFNLVLRFEISTMSSKNFTSVEINSLCSLA
ncbi:hypothetical protein TIFTF001_046294 [Ficus carica]|uniref:C-JID domain-containing protein n=1 Tax=Ficus carica TaxID=3494 RepID=A0AA87ZLQ2_FICCA|nr:hypothetical protein TIFTF001_046294 [Ficus carica]